MIKKSEKIPKTFFVKLFMNEQLERISSNEKNVSVAASTVVIVDQSSERALMNAKLVLRATGPTTLPNIFWDYINKKNSSCVINSIFAHEASLLRCCGHSYAREEKIFYF